MQLINPFLYYLLVRQMTTRAAWNDIKARFEALSVDNIEVASIPKVKMKRISLMLLPISHRGGRMSNNEVWS